MTTTTLTDIGAGTTLATLIDAQARARPDAVALVHADETVSYAGLVDQADLIAARLTRSGMGPGEIVGIYLERSIDLVSWLLGVLKVGAAYILLDPEYPVAWLRHALMDAGAAFVVTRRALAVTLSSSGRVGDGPIPILVDDEPSDPRPNGVDRRCAAGRLDDMACVMFTSGSTGRPKGVAVSHGALIRTLRGQNFTRFDADQVWLQSSPVSGDGFAFQLFAALLFGATCVLHPGQRPDPETIATLVAQHKVTQLALSASLFNLIVDEFPGALDGVSVAFTVGEAASASHVRKAFDQYLGLRVLNGYGPVESVIGTNCYSIPRQDVSGPLIPVGRPFADRTIYVLDDRLRPAPPGEAGEIYAAGGGLAFGYIGLAAATAERFVPDPAGAPGTRMYRTGDLGRWNPDGTLVVIGRIDAQVKIRGFRIEPGEIEAMLRSHEAVGNCAVVVRPLPNGEPHLAAFLAVNGEPPSADALREYLRRMLPEHMIPASFTVLDAMPLSPDGKLDRKGLPVPDMARSGDPGEADFAGDDVMREIARTWTEVLGVDPIRPSDDFFLLGGHSLSAARILHLLRRRLRVDLSLRSVLDARDLADLTRTVRELIQAGAVAEPTPPLRARQKR